MIRTEHLYYFITVARTASINAAALELNVTPPAVSHALKKLEEDLSIPLFTRSSKGVDLTKAGKTLYPYAKDIISLLQAMENVANNLQNATKEVDLKQCVLFGEASIMDHFFSAISRRLYAKFPELDLIIADKPLRETLPEIEADPFCCSLVLLGSDIQQQLHENHPSISQFTVLSQKPVVLAKKNSQWIPSLLDKDHPTLSIEDVVSLPYIAVTWNTSSYHSFTNLLRSYGTPNIVNLAPSLSILGTFLENDIGVTLGIHNINTLTANKHTVEIPLDTHDDFTLDYVFLFNSEAEPTFIQYLIQIIQDSFAEVQL